MKQRMRVHLRPEGDFARRFDRRGVHTDYGVDLSCKVVLVG
jgi:hypothetical protein